MSVGLGSNLRKFAEITVPNRRNKKLSSDLGSRT